MGWLSLANPALAVCLFGVSIPIVIHLLNRHDPRQIEFPTIRFLIGAVADRSFLQRFRRWILLALRVLLVGLVALAFLKPSLMYSRPAVVGKEGQAIVLLVDASMSMGYSRGGAAPLSRAKAEAARLLDALREQDRANLIVARAVPAASFPVPGPNLAGLKGDLDGIWPTAERADASAAVRMAVAQLVQSGAGSKELYIFSDFQRSNWSDVDLSSAEKTCRVYFVDVGSPDAANCAVTAVSVRPRAPVVCEPASVICEVANFGPRPADIPVRLSFENGEAMEKSVRIEPFLSVSVPFPCRMDRSGACAGAASIPADDLPLDDKRYFVATVREKMGVLLASDADPKDRRSASYFLSRALKPYRDDRGRLSLDFLPTAALGRGDLSGYDVILIAEAERMGRGALDGLLGYLNTGGSAVIFLCGEFVKENLAALEGVGNGSRVLPFLPGDLLDLGKQRGAFAFLREANFESPILRLFKDPEKGDLSSIRMTRLYQTPDPDEQAEVLLKYDNGAIAIAKRNVGGGTLLLCNLSPSPEAGGLAGSVCFVPLVHEIVRNMRPQEAESGGAVVGDRLEIALGPEQGTGAVSVEGPGGQGLRASCRRTGEGASAAVEGADAPGLYRVTRGGRTPAVAAVNVHPDESDLRPMDGKAIVKRTKSDGTLFVRSRGGEDVLTEARFGRPLWHYLLLASLVVICVEQAFAQGWRRK